MHGAVRILHVERVFEEGGTVTDEFACLTSEGERRPVEISAAPIDVDDGADGAGEGEGGHIVATVRELRTRE